jgi:small subunit ribosomal protein S7
LSSKELKKIQEDVKVFGKWATGGIESTDPGLKRYISVRPILLPHTSGRHEHQRFRKSTINVVERLIDDMMRPGIGGGGKARATNIVKNAMDIVAIRTKKNPIEILVRAIENAAPAEDVTRIAYGGIVYPISVDIAPQRRTDIALRHITEMSRQASHNNPRSVDECLAEELILAAARDPKSASVRRRDEIERIALASR